MRIFIFIWIAIRAQVCQQSESAAKPGYIINLCSGLEYLGTGYYCSLPGEKVIPAVGTINDLHHFEHYRLFDIDLIQMMDA